MKGLAEAGTKGGCEETKAVPEGTDHRAAASGNSTDIKQRHSQWEQITQQLLLVSLWTLLR